MYTKNSFHVKMVFNIPATIIQLRRNNIHLRANEELIHKLYNMLLIISQPYTYIISYK